MADPLSSLVGALDQRHVLPPGWATKADGSDPVRAAWAASTAPWLMARLLAELRPGDADRASAIWTERAAEPGHPPADAFLVCDHCARAIRAAIASPSVAELEAVLAEHRAQAARTWALGEDPVAMIDAAARLGVDPRRLLRAVCACARRAMERAPVADLRTRRALTIAERWAAGEDVTRPELYNASFAARDVPSAVPEGAASLTASAVAATIAVAHAAHEGGAGHPLACGQAVDMAMRAIAESTGGSALGAAAECAALLVGMMGDLR